MSRFLPWTLLPALISTVTAATSAEVATLPPHARLVGPKASQRFLVERRDGGAWTGDVSSKAVYRIEDEKVATVDRTGTVRPVANGRTTLVARVDGIETRADTCRDQDRTQDPEPDGDARGDEDKEAD